MKLFIVFAIIILVVFVVFMVSGNKKTKENKENSKCLTIKNYLLIRDSPYADELSKYTIHRKNNQLRFTRKGVGYTLFYLTIEEGEKQSVKLVGLDGYGIRDREFLKYICNLINSILNK